MTVSLAACACTPHCQGTPAASLSGVGPRTDVRTDRDASFELPELFVRRIVRSPHLLILFVTGVRRVSAPKSRWHLLPGRCGV